MDEIKHTVDIISVGALGAVLLGYIPAMTTVAAFIWMAIRIYDSILSVRLKHHELRKHNDQQPQTGRPAANSQVEG